MALLFFAFLLFATVAVDVAIAAVVVVLDHEPERRRRRRRRRRRGTEIFFYFLGGVVSSLVLALSLVVLRRVGPAEERSDLVIRYGSHKKVEIFDWWKLKTMSKWVGCRELGYFKWWATKIEWEVMSDEKNPNRALIFLEFIKNFITQLIKKILCFEMKIFICKIFIPQIIEISNIKKCFLNLIKIMH